MPVCLPAEIEKTLGKSGRRVEKFNQRTPRNIQTMRRWVETEMLSESKRTSLVHLYIVS